MRAEKIRSQLSDIRQGLKYFHGKPTDLPLGWALVPMRRAGFDGNDNNFDRRGSGPRVLTRDVVILQPHDALLYFLDDAEALDDCTPSTKWFTWADDEDLLQIPRSELRRLSKIAYLACTDAIDCLETDVYCLPPQVIANLQRYAALGDNSRDRSEPGLQ